MRPRPQAPAPPAECDLVMKGGVTSGVVYPGAIVELGRAYRLRNIGGTSAGAIGAAVAAAAELRRQRAGGAGCLGESLAGLIEDVGTPGFLAGLFQPTPATRPVLRMLLASMDQGRRGRLRVPLILWRLLAGRWWISAVAVAAAVALGWLTVATGDLPAALAAVLVAIIALLAAVVAVTVTAGLVAIAAKRSLDDPSNGFGMCSGLRAPGATSPALTEWLHDTLQRIADLPGHQPLTFADLERCGIRLEMTTTDLSRGRPQRLPFERDGQYRFHPQDMAGLFPRAVVEHLLANGDGPDEDGLHGLPAARLPVVVAVRMSLSFPILISAVRLYAPDREGRASRDGPTWFSDGGITSNFPVHLFDAWLPRRPTFGLDLQPHPQPLSTTPRASTTPAPEDDDESLVSMPSSGLGPPPSRWSEVSQVGVFVRQVADAAQNWRDNAQADLPGFRDRICGIRLKADEGGLNLNMTAPTIQALLRRGRLAGNRITTTFGAQAWRENRAIRYLVLMRRLQGGLHDAAPVYQAVRKTLHEGFPPNEAYGRSFHVRARSATERLIAVAAHWGPPPAEVDFDRGIEDSPPTVMRIGPPG